MLPSRTPQHVDRTETPYSQGSPGQQVCSGIIKWARIQHAAHPRAHCGWCGKTWQPYRAAQRCSMQIVLECLQVSLLASPVAAAAAPMPIQDVRKAIALAGCFSEQDLAAGHAGCYRTLLKHVRYGSSQTAGTHRDNAVMAWLQ